MGGMFAWPASQSAKLVHLPLFAAISHSGQLLTDLPSIAQLLRACRVFSQPLHAKGKYSFFGLLNECLVGYRV